MPNVGINSKQLTNAKMKPLQIGNIDLEGTHQLRHRVREIDEVTLQNIHKHVVGELYIMVICHPAFGVYNHHSCTENSQLREPSTFICERRGEIYAHAPFFSSFPDRSRFLRREELSG